MNLNYFMAKQARKMKKEPIITDWVPFSDQIQRFLIFEMENLRFRLYVLIDPE
jgi:hypothetical protein